MTTNTIEMPEGAPEEVVTNALVRDIDLRAFGHKGNLALITLDNGLDHSRPNTFGPQSLMALDGAITERSHANLQQLQLLASHLSLRQEPIFQHFHLLQSVSNH